ncbi:type II toxin-antitoxin system VapC family toxin [Candidatus Acetothermia bacterium]|nr:type II toxin-antitoxin system VapC family toxin [Candidatus Acetothermia bacterium]
MPEIYVLDSSALIAYFNGEPGGTKVRELLRQATDDQIHLYLHQVQLGEVYYIFWEREGKAKAELVLSDVRGYPITLKDRISFELFKEVGRLKATYRLSYADAFAVGLARSQKAKLISCDRHELAPLETQGEIEMFWVR